MIFLLAYLLFISSLFNIFAYAYKLLNTYGKWLVIVITIVIFIAR